MARFSTASGHGPRADTKREPDAPTLRGFDFSSIRIYPAAATLPPLDGADEDSPPTQVPDAGRQPDAGVPADAGTPARHAHVASAPSYSPHGSLPPVPGTPWKTVTFNIAGEFSHTPASGIDASCGEIRQEIWWDAAAAASMRSQRGGIGTPHGGFPNSTPAEAWIEDRAAGDSWRLGRRTPPYVVNFPPYNQYLTSTAAGAAVDMAHGPVFRGRDVPGFWPALHGQYKFRVYAVDICNGGSRIGGSDDITINW